MWDSETRCALHLQAFPLYENHMASSGKKFCQGFFERSLAQRSGVGYARLLYKSPPITITLEFEYLAECWETQNFARANNSISREYCTRKRLMIDLIKISKKVNICLYASVSNSSSMHRMSFTFSKGYFYTSENFFFEF